MERKKRMEQCESNKLYLSLSDKELSEKLGLSVKTIQRYNKSLIEKGIIKIIEIDGVKIKQFNL
jgi:DNA-binding Lrp family transcriptional regulator